MSILSRLWRTLRPIPQPEPLPPLPDGKLRIHLFSGNFASPQAAHGYCFATNGDAPEAITRDQPGAFIDTGFVEAVTENIPSRLAEFLEHAEVDQVIRQLNGANTLVIITEDAFADLPYTLTSNDTLTYMGSRGLCCTNRLGDSLHESSMIAGSYEQLASHKIQDHELVGLQ